MNIKEEARRLIDRLPETASWDEVMYEIHVHRMVEAALRATEAERARLDQEGEDAGLS